MLHEVEEGIRTAQAFFRRSRALQSDHAIRRVYEYLEDLKSAGYAGVQAVRDFQEDLKSTNVSFSSASQGA